MNRVRRTANCTKGAVAGSGDGDRGSVVLELPLAVGLLLLPVAVLMLVLPQWPQAQTIATSAAKQAATLYTTAETPQAGAAAAQAAVAQTAANFGQPMTLTITGEWCRGCTITATVTTDVPAVQVPFIGSTGTFHWSASSSSRIEDYRSIGQLT